MRSCLWILLTTCMAFNAVGIASAEDAPGLMFSTVLEGVKMDHRKGDFYLGRIQAVFLPEPTVKSNSIYPYNPDDGGKLWAVLTTAGGDEVARYDFYAQLLKAPFWLLGSCKVTEKATGNKPASGRVHLDKGEYSLDFYVEGKHFYKYPFKVDTLASESSFAPGDFSFLNGDWGKWGYLYYRNADSSQSMQWKIWMRNKGRESSKQVKVQVEVLRGDTLICTSRPLTTYSLRPEWTRLQFDFIFPPKGTSGGRYFKAKDLVDTPGSYTLTMKIDGEPYGEWKFEVADGKPQPAGRTERGNAEPLTFVEGGIDAFWYGKE